ncbi:hypothetical protein QWJ34_26970, partial [Saccharibacillus sp. CPCC 101409]|uniref:hypothetical protein n=1 Tax=Saccharibacillus sp. CPCC 101409 TaxID=3058041 RepID=UPI002670FDB6
DFTLGRIYQSNTAYIWEPKIDQNGSSYTNNSEYYTYNERTSNLGVGWTWAFPSVELRGDQRYLHFPDGTVYEVAAGGQGLVDYPLKDVTFAPSTATLSTKDASGKAVSAAAAYSLTDTLGTQSLFNAQGRWIGTKDAYGNVILVEYANTSVNDGDAYPLISRVIDTLNREIKFSYKANAVTVSYANKSLTFNKKLITGVNKKRNLDTAVNENGETISYGYTKQDAGFDADGPGGANGGSTTYTSLTRVTYPTGARSIYEYGKTVKHFGDIGTLEYYRVNKRYEELNESGTKKKNMVAYDYTNATDFSDS